MVTRPDVSDDVVVDFDHHSDAFNANQRTVNTEFAPEVPDGLEREQGRIPAPGRAQSVRDGKGPTGGAASCCGLSGR